MGDGRKWERMREAGDGMGPRGLLTRNGLEGRDGRGRKWEIKEKRGRRGGGRVFKESGGSERPYT